MSPSRRYTIGVLVACVLGLSSCASESHQHHAVEAAQVAAPTGQSAAGDGTSSGHQHGGHDHGSAGTESIGLWAVQIRPLGVIATDLHGRIVYRSDRDSATPPTPNCVADCAKTWNPLIVAAGQQPDLEGVDRTHVGTVKRPDGTMQMTLAGWPLYTRPDDDGELKTAGANGADGSWFAITPKGDKARAQ